MKIAVSELGGLPTDKRRTRIQELSAATQRPVNGEVKDLDREIAAYEARHGIDSLTLRARLNEGSLEETPDVCQWLMRLSLRDRLVELRARPR